MAHVLRRTYCCRQKELRFCPEKYEKVRCEILAASVVIYNCILLEIHMHINVCLSTTLQVYISHPQFSRHRQAFIFFGVQLCTSLCGATRDQALSCTHVPKSCAERRKNMHGLWRNHGNGRWTKIMRIVWSLYITIKSWLTHKHRLRLLMNLNMCVQWRRRPSKASTWCLDFPGRYAQPRRHTQEL